ncbi:MAG TPA: hypothetical protein VFQ44_16385 [Streptosporangiaceae bacterium]|nr:hypothetical protein [Streptosporangiaceae bacterium]
MELDEDALLASTGLDSLDDLEILAMADCPSAQRRFVATKSLRDFQRGSTVDVTVQLPPGQVANAVRLSAHLVLARSTPKRGYRVAFLRGSRIDSSEPFTLRLEGDSGRFPTEPVKFSELGLGNAPWTVLTTYDELSDGFLGSVRLLVNTEHPVGKLVLDPKAASRVNGLLHADVMRLLIANVAAHGEDAGDFSSYEGSVGQVLETMCQGFLSMSLRTAAHLYKDDPMRFDLILHDHLDPLAGVMP